MRSNEHWAHEPNFQAAAASFGDGSAVVETAIAIQQIPAPTFDERARGLYVAERMRALGLADVQIDTVGNVYGRRAGTAGGPALLIAAHLDTVFPAGTDLTVRRDGTRIYGPGLGDNSMGVAALLHLAQALQQHHIAHQGDMWFVANVGEERLGDLRGMRAAGRGGRWPLLGRLRGAKRDPCAGALSGRDRADGGAHRAAQQLQHRRDRGR